MMPAIVSQPFVKVEVPLELEAGKGSRMYVQVH